MCTPVCRPYCLLIPGLVAGLVFLDTCRADFVVGENFSASSSATVDEFNFGPTTPGKWGNPATSTPGGIVTWSLATTAYPLGVSNQTVVPLSTFMPAGYKAEIERAFDAWSSVADITFVEEVDNGAAFNSVSGNVGDIRIAGHVFDGALGTLAHAYYPPAVNAQTSAGDIHFDVAENWKIGFGGTGFDIFQVMSHEIGHAIGLGHSNNVLALMRPFYTEAYHGIQQDDINGAVALYGAATAIPEPSSLILLIVCCFGRLTFCSVMSKRCK